MLLEKLGIILPFFARPRKPLTGEPAQGHGTRRTAPGKKREPPAPTGLAVLFCRVSIHLGFRLRLLQPKATVALFPIAALLQQVDTLETLEDVSLGRDLARSSQTAMLTHFFFSCSKVGQ